MCVLSSTADTRREQITARHPDEPTHATGKGRPFDFSKRVAARAMSTSLIGSLGSSTFRLSIDAVWMFAHGLVLLFGIGTKALPLWDSKTRRNNPWGGLAVTVGPSGHTNSPHPSSREERPKSTNASLNPRETKAPSVDEGAPIHALSLTKYSGEAPPP